VAVVSDPQLGQKVADAMADAFVKEGKLEVNSARIAKLDQEGVRVVPS